jgi:hypothetical protein
LKIASRIDVEAGLPRTWESRRAALVIAHPGHELWIHHWLERARPLVLALTDASGRAQRSRLSSTKVVLDRAGARTGALYGRLSDRELYDAILSRRAEPFIALAEEMASILDGEGVDYVVGDAAEGMNSGHDVCRLLLNAALLRIAERRGRAPANYEFTLEGPPNACLPQDRPHAIVLALDDAAFDRKRAAVAAYPEVAADVDRILGMHEAAAFRVECLRPVRYALDIAGCFEHPCLYERHGEKRVAAGVYREVIRFRDHIAPLAERLRTGGTRAQPAYGTHMIRSIEP